MTWQVVARKDFRDAIQSRALWALVAVFVTLSLISTYAYIEVPELFGEPEGATFGGLLFFTVGLSGLFVPLAAIVVCYKSIAGERELGSIKLLLSLPTTRTDVFLGKLIGRAGVLAIGLGVGVLIGIGFGSALLGEIDVMGVIVFSVVTVVFIAAYASIMVGISATTGSTARATTLALAFFVVFELLWDVVPMGILYVTEGFRLPSTIPDWTIQLSHVAPSSAYFATIAGSVPDLAASVGADPGGTGVEITQPNGEAFTIDPAIGMAILLLWLILPVAIGRSRFDSSDL